jgi:hypothetical protein
MTFKVSSHVRVVLAGLGARRLAREKKKDTEQHHWVQIERPLLSALHDPNYAFVWPGEGHAAHSEFAREQYHHNPGDYHA